MTTLYIRSASDNEASIYNYDAVITDKCRVYCLVHMTKIFICCAQITLLRQTRARIKTYLALQFLSHIKMVKYTSNTSIQW